MVHQTAPCYLYLGQCNFYLHRYKDEGILPYLNYYAQTGQPQWLGDVADFNQILQTAGDSLWLIIQRKNLLDHFNQTYIQQILAQMTWIPQENKDFLVFRAHSDPQSLPLEPAQTVDYTWHELNNRAQTQLKGYTLISLNPSILELTLFWQAPPLANNYKVFAHLRNAEGANVAQADHVPWEHVPFEVRDMLRASKTALIRDRSLLEIPPDLNLADHHLVVGLYEANTGERLAIVSDTSGENGARLDLEIRNNVQTQ